MLRSRAVQLLSLLVLIVATAPASDVSAHSLTCNGVRTGLTATSSPTQMTTSTETLI